MIETCYRNINVKEATMKSPICEKLGIEFPLIAFTH